MKRLTIPLLVLLLIGCAQQGPTLPGETGHPNRAAAPGEVVSGGTVHSPDEPVTSEPETGDDVAPEVTTCPSSRFISSAPLHSDSKEFSIGAEEALEIARSIHDPQASLWLRLRPEFAYESKGEKVARPAWIAQTLRPSSNVTVYIHAENGGHFGVRQTEAPSPDPVDLGFIDRDDAIKVALQAVNTDAEMVASADLLENALIPDPPYGLSEVSVWRIQLDCEQQGVVLVDATKGTVIIPGMKVN